jgi:hypothetical protein
MAIVAAPFFRDLDGSELALDPLQAALVRAVLETATRMRRSLTYEIHLHVKRKAGAVGVRVVQHVDYVVYAPHADDGNATVVTGG